MQCQIKVKGQSVYPLMFALYVGAILYMLVDDWRVIAGVTLIASIIYAIENKYLAVFLEDRILYKRLFRKDEIIPYKAITLARFKSYCFALASTRLCLEYKKESQTHKARIKLQDEKEEIEVSYLLRQKQVPLI